MNEEIQSPVVMLVNDAENGGLTRKALQEAMDIADEAGLDLVQVGMTDNIPVCKLVNLSKLRYEESKRQKKSAKKQSVKEIRLNDTIADHDLCTKVEKIKSLLKEGDKVRIVIPYKGRSVAFIDRGLLKLAEINGLITVEHVVDKAPSIEGARAYMIVSPKSSKLRG